MSTATEPKKTALIIQYGEVLMIQLDTEEWRFPETTSLPGLNPFESLEQAVDEMLELDVVTQEVFFEHLYDGTAYAAIFALPMDDGIAHAKGCSKVAWLDIEELDLNSVYPPHQPAATQLQKDYS